ncbi:MAG: 1-(5-phosphoribosyl)-5-[(5-phosphoribosylamino)methylideneamino]imidazole-4-carboxamide isomerase [Endomicrobia bacterium]|nr:1-(5-phosphoribosyl)-5-[(5-phosphoribosylamino)methylideneamino]imidazole-4-carboxamide isomerase [Endomicrobiia bacterium]
MIVIPAVDIRQGNSVMLKQGKLEDETVHSTDPVFMAKLWKAKGAERIHVIDLDGSFNGTTQNQEIIKKICESVDIPVQVGGGIRDMKRVDEIFKMGASYVILGTVAVYNPEIVRQAVEKYGSKKIIVAVDAKDGKVAIGGWKDVTPVSALDLIEKLKTFGVEEIIYTDIARDGMLSGPDFEGLKKISKSGMRIIVSGGITTVEDIIKLKEYEKDGVFGAIVGSALYTDNFKLEDAIRTLESMENKGK